jgi:hypothetical protein
MSGDSESNLRVAARRDASFLRRAEPIREVSSGKLAILAAVLIAAVSGAITLLVLR